MGVTFSTYCKRCGVAAPEMGDFGLVGAPSLGPAKTRGGLTPFGVIYDAFAALGMVTSELAAFKAFLDAHGRHPLVQASDAGEEDLDDEGEAAAPPPKRLKRFRYHGRHVEAFYELACTACGDAFRSSSSDALVPFAEFAPEPDAVRRFRKNAPHPGSDDLYRVGGFPYDDVEAVEQFLEAHAGHALRARLDRGASAAVPKRGAAAPLAPEPWTPPDWRAEDHEEYLGPVSEGTLRALAGLHHLDPARRVEACAALHAAREPGALGFLVPLRDDAEAGVRAAAARAIGALDTPRALRPLGRFLLDESDDVRGAAREAVAARGASEEDALREARALRGPYAVWSSEVETPKPTREALEAAVRDPEARIIRLAEALEQQRGQPWATDLLFVLPVHPSWAERSGAAAALARVDDERAEPLLLALLEDEVPSVAAQAAASAGALKVKAAAPLLVRDLERGDRWLFERAAGALVAIGDPAGFAPLLAALGSPSADIRKAAAAALGALRDRRAVAPIAALLAEERQTVREAAAAALGAIGGPEAAAALAAHARSRDELDRKDAAWALGELMPEPAAIDALERLLEDPDAWPRDTAVHALARGQDDPRVSRLLVAAATRGNRKVATAAWRVLIRAGGDACENALVHAIRSDSPDEMVRDYVSSGNAALVKAARAARRGRQLPAPDPRGVRWGEGG